MEVRIPNSKYQKLTVPLLRDTKKTAFMGSYCAEAQKTRFNYTMRKSAFCGIYYVPLSDHLSEHFLENLQ